jgi:hypothetical protein
MKSPTFVVCLANPRLPVSLEVRKIYRIRRDEKAAARHLMRVIDESGDDYLFPSKWFTPIDLPRAAARLFTRRGR